MCLTLGAENIDEVKDPENLVKHGFLENFCQTW